MLRNFGKLLSGKALAGILSLCTLMMVTRSLGATGYGVLTLISGYTVLVGDLIALSGFHAVVRYGSEARAQGDHGRLVRLLRFAAGLELGFGAVAVAVAATLAPLVGPRLGWSTVAVSLAVPFSLAALAGVRATPQGVLQIAGRFDLIAWHQSVQPLVRLCGSALGWVLGWHLAGFLGVWLAAALAECASMWLLALWVLRRLRPEADGAARGRGAAGGVRGENDGLLRFIMAANVDQTLQDLAPNLTPLTVGWMLGPEAAGLFALSQRACNVLQQPAVLLGQAIFSTLAGQSARSEWGSLGRLVRRSVLIALAASVPLLAVFGLFGRPILHLLGGRGFSAKPELLMLLAGSRVLKLGAKPLSAGLVAIGKPGRSVRISVLTDLVLYPLLPLLLALTGLVGAGWHSLIQDAGAFALRAASFRRWLRRMPPGDSARQDPRAPCAESPPDQANVTELRHIS